MENREGLEFLKSKYNLHAQPEVESAEKRTETRTGEKLHNPAERIQNYLDRFKEIVAREDETDRERGLNALKKILHEEYLIKPENIPESYFELQQQIARELGHGTIEVTPDLRKEAVAVIKADQRASLDEWIDYLSSDDALYPDWAKYWAFRSVLGMSLYDQEQGRFGHRTKNTTGQFPDLNREALAYVVDLIQKKLEGQRISNPVKRGQNEFAEEDKLVSDEDFNKILTAENFSKYYAFAIEHVISDNAELFKTTDGEWRVFKKDSDSKELTQAIQGHGTGWCTAGEATAKNQLRLGDFYVYFSENDLGVAAIPRLAIRMQYDNIAEVRGVAHKQEIDPYISPVLEEKLGDFGEEGEEYKKKAEDMKHLTEIDRKNQTGEPLLKEDLLFLYEVKNKIEGFGYNRDPRIKEIRISRDSMADIKTVLDIQNVDENEFLTKLLELDSQELGKFLPYGMESGDYEKAAQSFIEQKVDKTKHLSSGVMEALVKRGYVKLLYKKRGDFSREEIEKILEWVADYEEENAILYSPKIFKEFYGEKHRDESLKFINQQLDKKNYKVVAYAIPYLGKLPSYIGNSLARNGHSKEVGQNLSNFLGGLSSKVAMSLIRSGEMSKLADNIGRFRELDYKVWEELNVANYFNVLDKSKESFSEEVRERYF